MADYKINPFAISYDTIQNNLRLMVANDNSTFTDFFNDGSGSSVIDVASALGAFFAYHVITQRKEFTLEQATNYKSLIGNAFDKGYNVSRGKNLRVKLTVTPNTTGALQSWSNVGQYSEYDVTVMNPVSYTNGIPTTMEVVIGNRASESIIVGTSNITLFRFVSDDVTDDVRLFLNEEEISDFSTDIKDLLYGKYAMLSNSYGSVSIFYLQEGERKYKLGDYLTIDYIVRNSIDFDSLSLESFTLPGFTVTNMELLTGRTSLEDKDSIRVKAALHAETEGLIRARADFKKVIQELDDTIASISDEDIQPGRIGIFILKDDMQPLSEEDKTRYQKLVESRVVSGVANTIYENAGKYKTPLKIKLTTSSDTSTSTSLISRINSDLLSYQYNIGANIDFDDIEKYIEGQEGIKVARITVPTSVWKPNKTYRISDVIIPTEFADKTYYVSSFNMTTGRTAPNWTKPDAKGYIVDNNILWKEYKGNPNGLMVWQENHPVKIGALVLDYNSKKAFECVGYATKSGTSAPDWKDVDSWVIDNNIVWERTSNPINPTEYKTATIYRIGDDITVNQGSAGEPNIVYFRAIDYAMPSGGTEPNWNSKTSEGFIEDGTDLYWSEASYPIRFLQLANNTYAEFESSVEA